MVNDPLSPSKLQQLKVHSSYSSGNSQRAGRKESHIPPPSTPSRLHAGTQLQRQGNSSPTRSAVEEDAFSSISSAVSSFSGRFRKLQKRWTYTLENLAVETKQSTTQETQNLTTNAKRASENQEMKKAAVHFVQQKKPEGSPRSVMIDIAEDGTFSNQRVGDSQRDVGVALRFDVENDTNSQGSGDEGSTAMEPLIFPPQFMHGGGGQAALMNLDGDDSSDVHSFLGFSRGRAESDFLTSPARSSASTQVIRSAQISSMTAAVGARMTTLDKTSEEENQDQQQNLVPSEERVENTEQPVFKLSGTSPEKILPLEGQALEVVEPLFDTYPAVQDEHRPPKGKLDEIAESVFATPTSVTIKDEQDPTPQGQFPNVKNPVVVPATTIQNPSRTAERQSQEAVWPVVQASEPCQKSHNPQIQPIMGHVVQASVEAREVYHPPQNQARQVAGVTTHVQNTRATTREEPRRLQGHLDQHLETESAKDLSTVVLEMEEDKGSKASDLLSPLENGRSTSLREGEFAYLFEETESKYDDDGNSTGSSSSSSSSSSEGSNSIKKGSEKQPQREAAKRWLPLLCMCEPTSYDSACKT